MEALTRAQKTLLKEAAAHGVRTPTQKTLDVYGLTAYEWLALLKAQGWACPICLKPHRTWNTDHDHVPGWKKMPPEERKRHVRGVLCWYCNHRVVKDTRDAAQAQRVANYLKAHERRLAK